MDSHVEHGNWHDREQRRTSRDRQRRAPSAEGEIGHWVRTAAILAPVLIGEFVKDPEKKWRFIRVTSVAAALLSEGLHSHKSYRNRESDRRALEACSSDSIDRV
jgi:hypothetical protein